MNESVYVDCSEIKEEFEGFLIKTTPNELMECWTRYENYTLEEIMAIYVGSYSFLRAFNREKLIELHNTKTKNWENWCNDVIIYYASRNILFQNKIPVIEPKSIPEHLRATL